MRTTVSIDDDVFKAVRTLAHHRSEPIGKIISGLVRKGLYPSEHAKRSKKKFPTFTVSQSSRPITLEDVKKIEDEI